MYRQKHMSWPGRRYLNGRQQVLGELTAVRLVLAVEQHAAEQGVFGAFLIIDLANIDVIVPLYRRTDRDQPAIVGRRGLAGEHLIGDEEGRLAVLRRIDPAVGER